jgi:steroid delta-isomerase-like uncharacterized protein
MAAPDALPGRRPLTAAGPHPNLGLAKPTGLALSPRVRWTHDRIVAAGVYPPAGSPSPRLEQQEDIMAQATTLSPQALITAAKALIEAYNDKDWERVKASITQDFVYDELATGRKVTGRDATVDVFKGWADAFPDSKGVYRAVHVAGNGTVVLEVTWKGTHRGPLQTPNGPIAATGKPFEVPACLVVEIAEEKARAQRQYFDMATLLRQLGVAG